MRTAAGMARLTCLCIALLPPLCGLAATPPSSAHDAALRELGRQWLTRNDGIGLSVGIYDGGQRLFHNFGVTQVVDGNWGVHAVVKKSLFTGRASESMVLASATCPLCYSCYFGRSLLSFSRHARL